MLSLSRRARLFIQTRCLVPSETCHVFPALWACAVAQIIRPSLPSSLAPCGLVGGLACWWFCGSVPHCWLSLLGPWLTCTVSYRFLAAGP